MDLQQLLNELAYLRDEHRRVSERLTVVEQWLEYYRAAGTPEGVVLPGAGAPAAGAPETAEQATGAAAAVPGAAAVSSTALPGASPFTSGESRASLESRIGGIWLNRIGVIAFLLGAAFFLKYAFDQGWINEITRVLAGAAAGLIFAGLGERLRRSGYRGYAQGLTGGGMALLYFSTYAAYHFYTLLPPLPAMALLALITAAAAALAVYQEAPAVAVLGMLSGFLTPVLFATGDPQYLNLLLYLLLLNLGLGACAWFRRWPFLVWSAFSITSIYLLAITLQMQAPPAKEAISPPVFLLFLTAFWVLYSAWPFAESAYRGRDEDRGWAPGAGGIFFALLATGFYYPMGYYTLQPAHPSGPALFTLALAAACLAGWLSGKAWAFPRAGLSRVALPLAALFLILALPVHFGQPWHAAAWTLSGAVLCYLGLSLAAPLLHGLAWGAFGAGLVWLAAAHWARPWVPETYRLLLNWPAFFTALFMAALLFSAWLYRKYKGPHRADWPAEIYALAVAAVVVFLMYGSIEINGFFYIRHSPGGEWQHYRNLAMLSVSLFWALCAALLAAAGFRWRLPVLRYVAIALFAVTAVKVFLCDLSTLDLLYRIISLVGVGVVMLIVSYVYQKQRVRGSGGDRGGAAS